MKDSIIFFSVEILDSFFSFQSHFSEVPFPLRLVLLGFTFNCVNDRFTNLTLSKISEPGLSSPSIRIE